MINARLVPDAQAGLTPGEAMAGMILNGLGCANRPLSLTPQFFANTPRDRLFHEGLRAAMFHRLTLGRTLDEAYTDGGDLWFHALAQAVCAQDGLDRRCNHLDTTSVSLSGAYVPEHDEPAMTLTDGSANDHRPDLQQAVLALMVSQDGGVPCGSKRWEGNTSDIEVVQERARALMAAFQNAPSPRYLIADATRSHEDHAPNRPNLGCITRIPPPIGAVSPVITQALTGDTWHRLDDQTRCQCRELCHDGRAQRWLVVQSEAALARAEATLNTARPRETEAVETPLLHRQATRFTTPDGAQEALAALAKRWTYHQVESYRVIEHNHDAGNGRPPPRPPLKAIAWPIQAHVRSDDDTIEHPKQVKACFVLGTNIDVSELSDAEVIAADTGQAHVEGGLRFLNDPLLVGSSLFIKKPNRIEGGRMVMTLALRVDSVAQRRLRKQ